MGSKIFASIKTLVEIITILGIIAGFLSDDFIKNQYIRDIVQSPYFLSIIVLFVIYIYILSSIKEKSISFQYRFKRKPESLNLEMKNLLKYYGNTINFFLKKENGFWINILDRFGFSLFVLFESPQGINLVSDRSISDFKIFKKGPQKLILFGQLSMSGRRKIKVDIEVEPNTSFEGEDSVYIKVYIAPRANVLQIISIELCNCEIFIQ